MKIWVMTFVAGAVLAPVTSSTQTIKDAAGNLRDAVVKKQRYMRGFSADAEVHWRWQDGALVLDAPKAHIFSALVARSIKASGNSIEISGDRYAVFRDKNQKLSLTSLNETVRISVDLSGADLAMVLPRLYETLFYRDLNEALAAIPASYKESIPPTADPQQSPWKNKPPAGCDCSDAAAKKCGDPHSSQNDGAKAPKLIYSVEPEFSEEARRKKFNGSVQTGIDIDASGKVTDVWIVRPTGMGLDTQAVSAVRQYRFDPATCHGQPIPVHLYIDTNFQIF